MAAFSSFQQHNPFLVDTLLLPSHNNTSINVPPYKLDSITQPYNPSNFPFNPFSNTNALSLDSIALMNSFDDIISQDNSSSHVKKLSTTTESSSAPSASHRRRKTHNGSINSKEEREGGKSKRQKKGEEGKDKTRSEEPPKDYIHVRARRGQATDSHSLAERVRREKISERMRILQKLVPGCDKVTGKALMLDEIINYVQSLQNQVEFLSMKLASLSPVVYDFGEDLDAFIVRPEMGQVGGATGFPPLVDNSLLHPHLPLDQGNINDEEQRQKIQNPSGFTDNSFCSFP